MFIRQAQPVADRPVAEYSAGERASFREAFRPLARRYRRARTIAYLCLASALGCLVLVIVLPAHPLLFPIAAACVFFLAALFFAGLRPWLACPACQDALDQEFGPYCPECGTKMLHSEKESQLGHCASCRRTLNGRLLRRYWIRACTHCGMHLDERGL
jgi:hypothetical protein